MTSPSQNRWNDDYSDEPTNADHDPVNADEEAQLISREEFEFEFDDGNYHAQLPRSNIRSLWDRIQGPEPPSIQKIRPFFPSLQKHPTALLDGLLPRSNHKLALLSTVLFLWLAVFSAFLSLQLPAKDGEGKQVLNLDCTDTLWRRKNLCGVDGVNCRPFNNTSFSFRCPAKCADVQVLNSRAVGPLDVSYRPLVIGNEVYRGDSFICGSAIHAGIVDSAGGGCGRINLIGKQSNFTQATRHGIESIAFDSYFPLSFSFTASNGFECGSEARMPLLWLSLITTATLSIFTTSPKIFFPIFTIIFAHVSFVSDPPTASYRNTTVLPDHLSMFAKRLLPAFFVTAIIWQYVIKRTLSGISAQYEKTLLWIGGFWIGALSNYTFDWIPISRLTTHDLEQQPGAKLALGLIVLVLAVIIAGQIYFFWLEARLLRYLALYALFLVAILLCLALPAVNLRIHHYILALLLLPGTSLQTRPSLLYQGILLGLFTNGIARWDFDSVLQTADALRGDARLGSAVPEVVEPVVEELAGNITARFSGAIMGDMDGLSVLVNDVERYRFFVDGGSGRAFRFEWTRPVDLEPSEYFRFAYMKSGRALDYSRAGTWLGNLTWVS